MTEADVEIGKLYKLKKYPNSCWYKKISSTVTIPCDENGEEIGWSEPVHPYDEVEVK